MKQEQEQKKTKSEKAVIEAVKLVYSAGFNNGYKKAVIDLTKVIKEANMKK